ncbi:hypothetical protein P7C73_g2425, partial [Tremellales sp. Uapishka_1]
MSLSTGTLNLKFMQRAAAKAPPATGTSSSHEPVVLVEDEAKWVLPKAGSTSAGPGPPEADSRVSFETSYLPFLEREAEGSSSGPGRRAFGGFGAVVIDEHGEEDGEGEGNDNDEMERPRGKAKGKGKEREVGTKRVGLCSASMLPKHKSLIASQRNDTPHARPLRTNTSPTPPPDFLRPAGVSPPPQPKKKLKTDTQSKPSKSDAMRATIAAGKGKKRGSDGEVPVESKRVKVEEVEEVKEEGTGGNAMDERERMIKAQKKAEKKRKAKARKAEGKGG